MDQNNTVDVERTSDIYDTFDFHKNYVFNDKDQYESFVRELLCDRDASVSDEAKELNDEDEFESFDAEKSLSYFARRVSSNFWEQNGLSYTDRLSLSEKKRNDDNSNMYLWCFRP